MEEKGVYLAIQTPRQVRKKPMYKNGMYRETDKMSDLICENYPMVLVMSRFGIALGFGEKNIGEVCRQNGVDACTFLTVVNFLVEEVNTPVENISKCLSIENFSKLKVVRKYYDTIYDICVEHDESYLINEDYVSHNTPYGVGNFFHSTWVDAISGGNPFNPIRLYWQMHPDRDEKWYEEMSAALGPKRTAQEIDGDFLSSGNTVFDLADIKAIEECLFDYPVINTRLKGQYKEFNEPDPNKEYFIGGDCATGRGTDYSAFTCMDKEGEEAAVYKGRIPLNKYARLLGDVGEKFNFAKLAPETNDVGMTVTTILQDEGYPNLYFYTKLLRKKRKNRPEEDKFPGWLTTTKNRSVIIENLEKDIREENVIIKDPFFVQEAYTFIYDGAGRPIARGKHRMNNSSMDLDLEGETYSDDAIFGKAITNHIRSHSPSGTVVIPQ